MWKYNPFIGALEQTSTTDTTKYDKVPVENLVVNTIKGGSVKNIDNAVGDVAITSAGWIENEKYRFFMNRNATAVSAEFDSAVRRTGRLTLKLSNTDATGTQFVVHGYNGLSGASLLPNSLSQYGLILKPSTKFRINCYVKTINVATNAAYISVHEHDSSGNRLAATASSKLSGTNDWTLLSITVTTNANTKWALLYFGNDVAGNVSDVWFDINSLTIEEVKEDTSTTVQVPTQLRPIFQAVTNIDNVDQAQTSNDYLESLYTGNNIAQTITPTKKKQARLAFSTGVSTGSPTGTIILKVYKWNTDYATTITGAVLASYYIASPAQSTDYLVDLPFNSDLSQYLVVFIASAGDGSNYWTLKSQNSNAYANGTAYANAIAVTRDLKFTTYYAKFSEFPKLISNGKEISVPNDQDGFSNGSIVDLDKGKYYANTWWDGQNDVAGSTVNLLNVFETYSNSYYDGNYNVHHNVLNGAFIRLANAEFRAVYSVQKARIVFRYNTVFPIKRGMLKYSFRTAGSTYNVNVFMSQDNVNYILTDTILWNGADTSYFDRVAYVPEALKNSNVIYIKFEAVNNGDALSLLGLKSVGRGVKFEADIDTSNIIKPVIYPISTLNQFSTEYALKTEISTATRIYFRKAKYAPNGIVTPCLEIADTSTNYYKYIPIPIDNSFETNPCVSIIVAETTNGQQVGTGSAESTTGYILNDGEYMTLSSAVTNGKIVYKVGTGTTTFSHITKNTVFLSSDGISASSDKNASLESLIIYGVRNEGSSEVLKDSLVDIQSEVKRTRTKIINITSSTQLQLCDIPNDVAVVKIRANATSGAITLTIPSAQNLYGVSIRVKKTDSSANAVTIDPVDASTIDGSSTHILSAQYDSVDLVSDAVNFDID